MVALLGDHRNLRQQGLVGEWRSLGQPLKDAPSPLSLLRDLSASQLRCEQLVPPCPRYSHWKLTSEATSQSVLLFENPSPGKPVTGTVTLTNPLPGTLLFPLSGSVLSSEKA